MKIVWTERDSIGLDVSLDKISRLGELVTYPYCDPDEVAQRIADADIIIPNKVKLNEKVLAGAPNVKLICEAATGYDNIDLNYCKSRGIAVTNVPGYSTDSVAQHTFALYFYLAENLRYYDYFVKTGKYSAQKNFAVFDLPFYELAGKTWGIVGLGAIGTRVAQIAEAFGARVIYYSTTGKNVSSVYKSVDFDRLLRTADVISIHCPLNATTKYLFNETAFAMMKKSAILLNLARGAIVASESLHDALASDVIAAAGLDVLEKEPIEADNELLHIADSGKLIITPHMAWTSVEARNRIVDSVAKSIAEFMNQETLSTRVG